MRWLPQRKTYPWDEFWLSLLERIEKGISNVKVLRTLVSGQLKYITNVARLQPWLRDENGDPLFLDLATEIYLAKEYTEEDLDSLGPYGLCSAGTHAVIDRVENDLACGFRRCRMRNPLTDNQWHSLAARALMKLEELSASSPSTNERFKELKLVPLGNGTWVSATSSRLYYSHSEQLTIPDCLGLRLVDTDAANNPDRRALFDKLGVTEALVKDVRALVLQEPLDPVGTQDALLASVTCLKFLYLSEGLVDNEEAQADMKGFRIYDQYLKAYLPTKSRVYIPTSDEYGPLQTLTANGKAPRFPASFLNYGYLADIPATPLGQIYCWEEWLPSRLRLFRHVKLITRDSQKRLFLSLEFRYLERHRPERLLGALQRAWEIEGTKAVKSADVLEGLRTLEVPCNERDEFSLGEPLATTYLPLPELKGKLSRYVEDEGFLFLDLGEPITSSTYTAKWGFLVDHLGVGHTDDLRFYLSILKTIRFSNAAAGVRRHARILDVYEAIHARCREADNFLDAQAETRQDST